MNTTTELNRLNQEVENIIQTIERDLQHLSLDVLNWKENPQSWSILECFQHLNLYARYYVPAIKNAIAANQGTSPDSNFKFSWMGKKSVDMMHVENTKKQKTVKHMNPNGSQLDKAVLIEFLQFQTQLLDVLQAGKKVNLNSKKVKVEFFKLLKLRIGESLTFVVEHQRRHLKQALKVKQVQGAMA